MSNNTSQSTSVDVHSNASSSQSSTPLLRRLPFITSVLSSHRSGRSCSDSLSQRLERALWQRLSAPRSRHGSLLRDEISTDNDSNVSSNSLCVSAESDQVKKKRKGRTSFRRNLLLGKLSTTHAVADELVGDTTESKCDDTEESCRLALSPRSPEPNRPVSQPLTPPIIMAQHVPAHKALSWPITKYTLNS